MQWVGGIDMKRTFLNHNKPLLTTMVQASNPQRVKELIDKSLPKGAEAFGMQFEKMSAEYRNTDVYKELFSYTDKPIYITNYRDTVNKEKSDDDLANELLEFADCGATLCDVIGDLYDKQPDELAVSDEAVKKQIKLIDSLHQKGVEVLISSHMDLSISPQRVLEIALEHEKRGADISKIVTQAKTMEQQIDYLKAVNLLKENLKIPFLLLCTDKCHILRRIGGELGCCMYLCVNEYDELATPEQPLLDNIKAIRDNISK